MEPTQLFAVLNDCIRMELSMSALIDALAKLHTSAIDARNGYWEAVKQAEGKGLTPLFSELAVLHDTHAEELAQLVIMQGQTADPDGSFMSLVHKSVIDVRSLFGGLDESALPGLIDGEKRNIAKYDEALREPDAASARDVLDRQKSELLAQVDKMSAMRSKP
jgi:uncharacterized protein (TIGR02284 family)